MENQEGPVGTSQARLGEYNLSVKNDEKVKSLQNPCRLLFEKYQQDFSYDPGRMKADITKDIGLKVIIQPDRDYISTMSKFLTFEFGVFSQCYCESDDGCRLELCVSQIQTN